MTKAKPRKKGRPSLYTEALAAKICRRLAGSSILPRRTHHGPTQPYSGHLAPKRSRSTLRREIAPVRALSERSPRRRRNGAQDGDRASSDTQRVQHER